MIHELIFAHPRPGMSEEEFQHYWVDVHAPQFAGKIPQIRRYLVDTRIPFGPDPEDGEPLWSGIAEIWLDNAEDQLASLLSPELVDGARADEPKWAAFWQTVVMDTEAHVLRSEPVLDETAVKLVVQVKRAAGSTRAEFKERSLGAYARFVLAVPGLRRYLQCHNLDGAYAVGEAVLDAVHLLTFDSVEDLEKAAVSPEFRTAMEQLDLFVEPQYVHRMAVREHWIIGTVDPAL